MEKQDKTRKFSRKSSFSSHEQHKNRRKKHTLILCRLDVAGWRKEKGTRLTRAYVCYQLKIELHTGLQSAGSQLCFRLALIRANNVEKQYLIKSHRQHAYRTPCCQDKLHSAIKVNECLIWHGVHRKLCLLFKVESKSSPKVILTSRQTRSTKLLVRGHHMLRVRLQFFRDDF